MNQALSSLNDPNYVLASRTKGMPPRDTSRDVQMWQPKIGVTLPATILVWDMKTTENGGQEYATNPPSLKTVPMTPAMATANLPNDGTEAYLPYLNSPFTPATTQQLPNNPTIYNGKNLCSAEDADGVLMALAASGFKASVRDDTATLVGFAPNGETRRYLTIVLDGKDLGNAGQMAAQQFFAGYYMQNGVRTPKHGVWTITEGTPSWTYTPEDLTKVPVLGQPQLPIPAGMHVAQVVDGLFTSWALVPDNEPAAPSAGGAGLTADQAAALAMIPEMDRRIAAIAKIYGIA